MSAAEVIPFPSLSWFEHLAAQMNENRARQEQLGYVDCVVQFTVTDGSRDGTPWHAQVVFEEFSATSVRAAGSGDAEVADFVLEASLATWGELIDNIAANGGRPDLEHTLNRLSHFDTPLRVWSSDIVRKDMYFRYNQSLQEFINASSRVATQWR